MKCLILSLLSISLSHATPAFAKQAVESSQERTQGTGEALTPQMLRKVLVSLGYSQLDAERFASVIAAEAERLQVAGKSGFGPGGG